MSYINLRVGIKNIRWIMVRTKYLRSSIYFKNPYVVQSPTSTNHVVIFFEILFVYFDYIIKKIIQLHS